MNCRPGDLARVFRVTHGQQWAMDRIVRVTTQMHLAGEPGWVLEEPMRDPDGIRSYQYVLDSCLKPIRDPGDDAQDESMLWLPPVPIREGQKA